MSKTITDQAIEVALTINIHQLVLNCNVPPIYAKDMVQDIYEAIIMLGDSKLEPFVVNNKITNQAIKALILKMIFYFKNGQSKPLNKYFRHSAELLFEPINEESDMDFEADFDNKLKFIQDELNDYPDEEQYIGRQLIKIKYRRNLNINQLSKELGINRNTTMKYISIAKEAITKKYNENK